MAPGACVRGIPRCSPGPFCRIAADSFGHPADPAPCDPEACFDAQAQCLRAFDPPRTALNPLLSLASATGRPRAAPRAPSGLLGELLMGLRLIYYLQYKHSIWPAAPPPESPQIAPWPLRGPLERLWGSPCCPEGVPRAPKELPEQPQGARRASQGGHDNPSFGNLGQDGRSGGILTTPRRGISMRICLDRSKASKQP